MEKCNGKLGDYCSDCGFRFFCFTNPRALEPQPDYGELCTIEDFIGYCETGSFIDYDGSGYYATETLMTRIEANPSDIKRGRVDKRWSHVMWFNK